MGNMPENGTVTSILTYGAQTSGTCTLLNILRDGADPNNLVDYDTEITQDTTLKWWSTNAVLGASLSSGTNYWIGAYVRDASCPGAWSYRYDSGTGYMNANPYSYPPNATFSRDTSTSQLISAYITYTTSGGNPSPSGLSIRGGTKISGKAVVR
jgi:hypothetical protein